MFPKQKEKIDLNKSQGLNVSVTCVTFGMRLLYSIVLVDVLHVIRCSPTGGDVIIAHVDDEMFQNKNNYQQCCQEAQHVSK